MMNEPQVILVDENDREVGVCGKLQAHQHGGRLHRAFSVFIFNSQGEMLLQRRAAVKYHFAGLWTNACCSHPAPGQSVESAAELRLRHEMGFTAPLVKHSTFIYRAEDPRTGLTEHELDHIFTGRFDGEPRPNAEEVSEWKWIGVDALNDAFDRTPEAFTPWFRLIYKQNQITFRDYLRG